MQLTEPDEPMGAYRGTKKLVLSASKPSPVKRMHSKPLDVLSSRHSLVKRPTGGLNSGGYQSTRTQVDFNSPKNQSFNAGEKEMVI